DRVRNLESLSDYLLFSRVEEKKTGLGGEPGAGTKWIHTEGRQARCCAILAMPFLLLVSFATFPKRAGVSPYSLTAAPLKRRPQPGPTSILRISSPLARPCIA